MASALPRRGSRRAPCRQAREDRHGQLVDRWLSGRFTTWAVVGVFANRLARGAPRPAHALLTRLHDGGYVVSVRAPLDDLQGADSLCRQFPTGGGRQGAAGVNRLPEDLLAYFVVASEAAYV